MTFSDSLTAPLPLRIVAGGTTRSASVRNALDALADDPEPVVDVFIHDAARPFVSPKLLADLFAALGKHPAAAPALPVVDALWTGHGERVTGLRDRSGLYRAQTPQAFRFDAILNAYRTQQEAAADDVAVALAAGLEVAIVSGEETNFKLTYPQDFARAEHQIKERSMDVRTGNGFDVHAFEDGDHVILCGVKIPHTHALRGHSDADVGMHAVTDAIYGALGDGDIGQHFPPSDPQWKGAASEIFLRHAVELAASRGYIIGNMDVTLICEHPKIGPHAADMKQEMGRIMGMDTDRVSVKATTSEGLGFTGRGEGIAALASITLVTA